MFSLDRLVLIVAPWALAAACSSGSHAGTGGSSGSSHDGASASHATGSSASASSTGTSTSSGGGSDGGVCQVGCPSGYTCDPAGVCRGGSPTGLDFELVAYTLSGTVTVNGAPPSCPAPAGATSPTTVGFVGFEDAVDQRDVSLPVTCTAGGPTIFTGLVYPGTYSVIVGGEGPPALPIENKTVATALVVKGPASGMSFDVAASTVSGTLTLNGAAPTCTAAPGATATAASVTLVKQSNGVSIQLDATCTPNGPTTFASAPLGPGTYSVTVVGKPTGSNLPPISDVVAKALVVQGTVGNLVYDIKTYPVSGTVTLNGATPTCSAPAISAASVAFRDDADRISGGVQASCTAGGPTTFSGQLPAGTYAVSVQGELGSNLPGVALPVAGAVGIQGPTSGLTYDVKTYDVGGTVTLNGAAPTCATAGPVGTVTFTEASKTFAISLPATCAAGGATTFAGVVPPATYDVSLTAAPTFTSLPSGTVIVAKSVGVAGTTKGLSYDVKAYPVSGTVTLNGAAPACPQPAGPGGFLTFNDATSATSTGVTATCATGGPTVWSGLLYAGTYAVSVSGGFGSMLPGEPFPAALALDVKGALAGLAYDVKAYPVSGTVSVNGGSPPCGPGGTVVTLRDAAQSLSFLLAGTCKAGSPATFSGLVYPGTYAVTTYGDLVVGELAVP